MSESIEPKKSSGNGCFPAIAIVAVAVVLIAMLVSERTPTFTPRILDNEDGTYTVEYYFPSQDWHKDVFAYRVSLEEATNAAAGWEKTAQSPKKKYVNTTKP